MSLRTKTYLLFLLSLCASYAILCVGYLLIDHRRATSPTIVIPFLGFFALLTAVMVWMSHFKNDPPSFLPDPKISLRKSPLVDVVSKISLFPLLFYITRIKAREVYLLGIVVALAFVPFIIWLLWTRRVAKSLPPGDPQVDWNAELKESSPVL